MAHSGSDRDGGGREHAERLLARFVRNVTRSRRAGWERAGGRREPTNVVSPPKRPSRRVDEDTAPYHKSFEEPSPSEVGRRRLLGLEELGTLMDAEERRRFLLELAALYRHGHIDNVVAELEAARRRFPLDAELHGALADFFLSRGDLPRAVELLFSMVDACFERRDPEAARRCLERVRAIDPENRRLRSFEKLLRSEEPGVEP